MHTPITSAARGAVLARLADALYGFNARYSEAAAILGASLQSVDWNPHSKQLYQSFLSPDAIEDTSPAVWPIVCLYGARSISAGRAKFNVFSGPVHVYVDFHLTAKSSQAPRNFEPQLDAVEDALIATFNAQPAWPVDDRVCYTGEIDIQRLGMTEGKENWRQTLRCRLTLEIDSN